MDENQPNKPEPGTDPEWERVQKLTPGLEDTGAEDEAKAKADAQAKEEADKAAADKKAADDAEKAKADEEAKAKTDAEAADDEDEGGKDDESKKPKSKRPEKYIPIKQYTEEKKLHKETLEQKDKRIAELEAIAEGKADTTKNDEAIRKYAEKHGVSEDEARVEVDNLREVLGVGAPASKPADKPAPAELSDAQKASLAEAEQIQAEKAYQKEFKEIGLPELKKHFPDATPEQIQAAEKELEKIACTSTFLDKTLDFVVFKSIEDLKKTVFKPKLGSPESQRSAPAHQETEITVEDFRTGKISFSKLADLPSEQQAKIVEDMDVKTYDKFTRWMNENDALEINRGGRKVNL